MAKKLISMAAAGLLATTMVVPAFATDPTPNVTDITEATPFEYTGQVNLGTIKVTMATSDTVFVNPYEIEVKVGETTSGGTTTDVTSTNKIISPTQSIKNQSDTGLKISVTPTGTPGSKVTLVDSKDKIAGKAESSSGAGDAVPAATNKSAYVAFQVMESTDGATPATDADWKATAASGSNPAIAFKEVPVVSGKGTLTDTGVVMKKPASASAATYAVFRITGDAVSEPVKPDTSTGAASGATLPDPWTADDTVNVSVAFTFTPCNPA